MIECSKHMTAQTNSLKTLLWRPRIVDNMPVTWCYDVEENQKYCNPGFPIGCLVTTDGRVKDACVINVSSIIFSPVAVWFLEKGKETVCEWNHVVSCILCLINLCVSGRVQQQEYILCVQPRRHQDLLPQWRVRKLARRTTCWCYTGTKEVEVFIYNLEDA